MNKQLDKLMKAASLLYELNQTEISCLTLILGQKSPAEELTRDKLSRMLGRDDTTITRALKKLEAMGLIFKEKKCCTHGKRGRYFVYFSLKPRELKEKIKEDAERKYRAIIDLLE